jgi:arginyl-tRNA synthetase
LFELSQTFNTFYENNSVINADSAQSKSDRAQIAQATAQVLKNGLNLLGIEAPEEM